MILCIFPWPLRCHLALPEDTSFVVRTSNGIAHVRCRTSEGGSILSYRGEDLSWVGPGYDGLRSMTTIHYVSGYLTEYFFDREEHVKAFNWNRVQSRISP